MAHTHKRHIFYIENTLRIFSKYRLNLDSLRNGLIAYSIDPILKDFLVFHLLRLRCCLILLLAIEQFLKQGTGGVIVNPGSIHSFVALPNPTAYSSAKGGVKLLTQNLCTAYAKEGIRVNAVCPGYIDTPLLAAVDAQKKEYLASLHPQGRLGKPEEIAKAVLILTSDDASFVNGTTLLVDGGYTAH